MHPALRLRWNNSNRAADGVLGCCLRGDYHHYGSGLETASTSDALGSASSVAHCVELCRQLSVCCHNLDQPSSSLAFCPGCHTKAYMVEFCTSIHDFTHTCFNCLDISDKARSRAHPCLCSGVRDGQHCFSRISAGGIVSSE